MANNLFISDLHLDDRRPEISRAFFLWLDQWKGKAENLYILGDFFEIWLGDDAYPPIADAVAMELEHFAKAGTKIFIMHGNRDFLLGEGYASRCGAQLIFEPMVIELNGARTLLMHGDSLCTEDQSYMQFRQQVRNPQWQQEFLAMSVADRVAFGEKARATSRQDTQYKAEDILDVTPREVSRIMEDFHVSILIHGHTHRPARHPIQTDFGAGERIVLGDWGSKGWCLIHDSQGLSLNSFDIAPSLDW